MRGVPRVLVAVVLVSMGQVSQVSATDKPCPKGPDSCNGRVVIDAGEGGFEAGLYYAGPGGVARRVRQTGDVCADCEWQTTPACDGNEPALPDDVTRGEINCARAAASCPGGVLLQVWLKRPAEPWRRVDDVCVPIGSRVSSLRDLAPDVGAAFRRLPLPAPQLRVQPAVRAIVGIPSIFYAAPEREHHASVAVDGFAVALTAIADRWTWFFDDAGAQATTTDPGRPYPDQTVTHTYRRTGGMTPSVTCEWRGTYVVAGTAAVLPVGERVSRTTGIALTVHEARAQLVGNP